MHSLILIVPSSSVQNSIGRSPLRLGFVLITLALTCTTLSPTARAADGGLADFNTAEGTNALASLTDGSNNTAIGADALAANTTGRLNTADGSSALASNTTGSNNTAAGAGALDVNTTGGFN